MRNSLRLALVISLIMAFLPLVAGAQDEQWLQYRSSREAMQIIGGVRGLILEVTSEEPQGVELPEFKCDAPFFARWSTAMVKAGGLWIAFDRASAYGQYDLLYIDSNGNGHLNDETAITAYRTDRYSAYFGPVKMVFEGEDGPVTYHLNFRFYNYNERNRRLYAYSGGWYEGDITVKGAKKHCTLIDYNVNGTFDDKSLEAHKCDHIRIGKKGDRDTCYVGNFIEVDGVLYRPEIARDGAYIKLTKAEDVTFGNIRLPESITEFAAGGENGLFVLKPKKGTGSLPVGQYCIEHWAIERKDDAGSNWKLQGGRFSEKGHFNVTEMQETELSIVEPIISTLEAQNKKGTYYFSQKLKGKLNESIYITLSGKRAPPPKLHIKSKDGTYDQTFDFKYG